MYCVQCTMYMVHGTWTTYLGVIVNKAMGSNFKRHVQENE